MEITQTHLSHTWDRKGNLPTGAIRTCTECGFRQVKQSGRSGGTSWQTPAWLQSAPLPAAPLPSAYGLGVDAVRV